MENGNFHLFAAKGKWKRKNSDCLLQTERENFCLFVGRQMINGNLHFLCQQTCPSMNFNVTNISFLCIGSVQSTGH